MNPNSTNGVTPCAPAEPTEEQIRDWAWRHDIIGSYEGSIKPAFDDARSLVPHGVTTCPECHGTREVFGHAEDCNDDLCALNGDMHSCGGKVEPCNTCGFQGTGAGHD